LIKWHRAHLNEMVRYPPLVAECLQGTTELLNELNCPWSWTKEDYQDCSCPWCWSLFKAVATNKLKAWFFYGIPNSAPNETNIMFLFQVRIFQVISPFIAVQLQW